MVKRLVAAVVVVVVLVASYWAYLRYTSNQHLRDGDVVVADGHDAGEPVRATPSRSDTPGTVNTVPVAATAGNNGQSASLSQLQNAVTSTFSSNSAPASDSQTPNAPNGMAFSGSGQYQVYRQGNLTWRINTADGSTCILFATNEEWRKPIVYSHGCPTS